MLMHMLCTGSLYLKRNWEGDRVSITEKLRELETGVFPRPFWIGVYPEGTRITPEKKEKSVEFARARGRSRWLHLISSPLLSSPFLPSFFLSSFFLSLFLSVGEGKIAS